VKHRTTHRSKSGKKLFAVRDLEGRFVDIQTYARAHRKDMRRKKRRKSDKEDPNSRYWRNKADILFSKLVRARDGKCIKCGATDHIQCCHILPREERAFRWHLENAITLCPSCHKWSRDCSFHKNPARFFTWLAVHQWSIWNSIGRLTPTYKDSNSFQEIYKMLGGE
jgi:5-methylcytosine-specific restriction endonuclease McrA